MEIKTYVVLDNGQHEYNIVEKPRKNGRILSLYYSNADFWTAHTRGKLAMKMTITGNGVRFSKNIKSLDYSELAQMRMLMNFEQATDSNEYNRLKLQVYTSMNDTTTKPIEI